MTLLLDSRSAPHPDKSGLPSGRLSERLDREWAAMSTKPQLLARARAWDLGGARFADLDELLRAAGFYTLSTPIADEVLRRLVVVARDDELAARIVLQRILPGLLAITRRRRFYGDPRALEEVVGAAWIVIRTYRAERRRIRVAANLVRDAAYRAFVAPSRLMSATEIAVDPVTLDERPCIVDESPCDELARLLADAEAAGLPAADLELVRELVRVGSVSVAAGRKITPRTVRNHRDRVAALIRELALAA